MLKFAFVIVIYLLLIIFAAWSLVRLLPLETKGVVIATVLLVLLVVGLFVATLLPLMDSLPLPLSIAIYQTGNTLFVASVYATLLMLLLHVLHLIPGLRDYMAWLPLRHSWTTLAVVLLSLSALLVGGYANYMHKRRIALSLPVSGLNQPMRLVMLSDLHLGYHNRADEARRWVDLINKEQPDAVVIAGDIVDHSSRAIIEQDIMSELRRIQAPVYASLGNHEYFAPMSDVERILSESNITLLRDSVARVGDLYIIGRDDRTNRRRRPLSELMAQAPQGAATVLLDHQPYALEEAEAAGISLQLSGHTHRGQFWPGSWVTDLIYEQSHGYLRKSQTHYYVSSGMGIWGAKVRLGTQSEYVVIQLE